jgi:hypothetical protein
LEDFNRPDYQSRHDLSEREVIEVLARGRLLALPFLLEPGAYSAEGERDSRIMPSTDRSSATLAF